MKRMAVAALGLLLAGGAMAQRRGGGGGMMRGGGGGRGFGGGFGRGFGHGVGGGFGRGFGGGFGAGVRFHGNFGRFGGFGFGRFGRGFYSYPAFVGGYYGPYYSPYYDYPYSYGGYSPYGYPYSYGAAGISIVEPYAAPPVVISQNYAPAPPVWRGYESEPDERPVLYLIAFRDKTIRAAVAYWVEGGALHYLDTDHHEQRVALDRVDREFSRQLNRERRVPFRLP